MLSCLLLQLEGLNFEFLEQRAPKMLASIWPSRDKNHGLKGHNSEQRAPRMLASIWPSRDENHGQDGHNLELGTAASPPLWATYSVR